MSKRSYEISKLQFIEEQQKQLRLKQQWQQNGSKNNIFFYFTWNEQKYMVPKNNLLDYKWIHTIKKVKKWGSNQLLQVELLISISVSFHLHIFYLFLLLENIKTPEVKYYNNLSLINLFCFSQYRKIMFKFVIQSYKK